MSRDTSQRRRLRCPNCQGKTRHVQRAWVDRLRGLAGIGSARFRCRDQRCGWVALMNPQPDGWAPVGPWLAPLLRRSRPALLGLATVAVATVAWAAWQRQQPPPPQFVEIGPRQVARGASYDGDELPADHPMTIKVVAHLTPALASAPAATVTTPGATAVPLAMRRHCAWGQPGRNPYRGSVEQALTTARLPAEVVHQVTADIAARRRQDRVRITHHNIVAERSGRQFDHRHVAMTYGMTLCADTRVNFKAGHVERADLYEALATDGRKFSVMVPDVCGNVSVLAETAAADDAGAGDGSVKSRLPDELVYRNGDAQAAQGGAEVQRIPEPGTLACVALGVALAIRLARRKVKV